MPPKNGKRNGKKARGRKAPPREFGRIATAPRPQPLMLVNNNTRTLNERISRLKGSDFIGGITVKANPQSVADRILATVPITPSGYIGTRISGLANFWERYRFTTLHLRYVPAVPMTLACQLVLYIDTDPNDDPTTISAVDALIRQGVAQTGAQQWNFNVPKKAPLARRADDQWYYTGVDKQNERFSRQGTAYILQLTRPMDLNGAPIPADLESGTLFLDWEVEFHIPQIEPELVQAQLGLAPVSEIRKTRFGISEFFPVPTVVGQKLPDTIEGTTVVITGGPAWIALTLVSSIYTPDGITAGVPNYGSNTRVSLGASTVALAVSDQALDIGVLGANSSTVNGGGGQQPAAAFRESSSKTANGTQQLQPGTYKLTFTGHNDPQVNGCLPYIPFDGADAEPYTPSVRLEAFHAPTTVVALA